LSHGRTGLNGKISPNSSSSKAESYDGKESRRHDTIRRSVWGPGGSKSLSIIKKKSSGGPTKQEPGRDSRKVNGN